MCHMDRIKAGRAGSWRLLATKNPMKIMGFDA